MQTRAASCSTSKIKNGALCIPLELAAKYHKQLCGSGCVPKPSGYISPRAGYTAVLLTSPCAGELQSLHRAGCSCLFPLVLGTSFAHSCSQNVFLMFGTNEPEIGFLLLKKQDLFCCGQQRAKAFFLLFFISACSLKLLLFPTVSYISDVAW